MKRSGIEQAPNLFDGGSSDYEDFCNAQLYPSVADDFTMLFESQHVDTTAVLTFGESGVEAFRTTSGEIVLAYLLAATWKRLPGPGDDWLESVPVALRLSARDASGELVTDFSTRDAVAARDRGLAWFKQIETNDDDAPCPHCGSEWFAVFEDAAGHDHRTERLSILTSVLALSECALLPTLPNAVLIALEQHYDHVRDTEHVLLAAARGEHV